MSTLPEAAFEEIDAQVRGYRETAAENAAGVPGSEDWLSDWETGIVEAVLKHWPAIK